jgi:hypothetical protein
MSHKSVITAAAIAGVVLAAGAAIGANIGLLSAADDSEIGALSATGGLPRTDTRVVDIYLDDSASTTQPTSTGHTPEAVQFAVDPAGTVSVIKTSDGIHLADVVASPGWTWRLTQAEASAVTVTFTNGSRTLDFAASVGPDGAIVAGVNEPIAAASPTASDDVHKDDRGDDVHDEEADEEHEGGDDDD